LPSDLPFFYIDLGQLDVLLAASDFYAAAASSDYRVIDSGPGGPRLVAKGLSHDCLYLEPFFERLFSPSLSAGGAEATAFLMRRAQGLRAFVIGRAFELLTLPLREFRLVPRGIRARQASYGLVALRFEGGKRLQVLMSPGRLGPTGGAGGAVSESS
jgi:hypothetical protein